MNGFNRLLSSFFAQNASTVSQMEGSRQDIDSAPTQLPLESGMKNAVKGPGVAKRQERVFSYLEMLPEIASRPLTQTTSVLSVNEREKLELARLEILSTQRKVMGSLEGALSPRAAYR